MALVMPAHVGLFAVMKGDSPACRSPARCAGNGLALAGNLSVEGSDDLIEDRREASFISWKPLGRPRPPSLFGMYLARAAEFEAQNRF